MLHFLPYFLSERTLFLHHYLPAVVFKIILVASVTGHLTERLIESNVITTTNHSTSTTKSIRLQLVIAIYVALLSAVGYTFVQFLPLSYGIQELSAAEVAQLKWRKTWHLLIHKQ